MKVTFASTSELDSDLDSDVPTSPTNDDLMLSSINNYLQDLRKKHTLILRKEEFLGKKRQKVAAQIDLLQKLALRPQVVFNADAPADEEAGSASGVGAKRGRGLVACQLNPPPISRRLVLPPGTPAQGEEPVGQLTAELSPSPSENETKGPRYLCILNGCVICCLDLKLRGKEEPLTNARHVPPFPKIATLRLLEEGLPVSGGLLRLGSHTYFIGGQKFPVAAIENPGTHCTIPLGMNRYGSMNRIPKGFDLYKTLCLTSKARGTSCVAYRLSLSDDASTLSYSSEAEGNKIGTLLKPKIWPIVEKIGDKIHVTDSLPEGMTGSDCHETFTHEVLDRRHHWKGISTVDVKNGECLVRVTVVGDRMFAYAGLANWVFDSKRKEWIAKPRVNWLNPFTARDVWGILAHGIARCGGQFPQEEGGSNEPLYVLIGVVGDFPNRMQGTYAVAYLVTSEGQVVCTQRLPHFFEKPVQPLLMMEGTMINVDEEAEEGKPTMLCSIVSGSALLNGRKRDDKWMDYLFINTFSVEMLTHAVSDVAQLLAKKRRKDWPVELEFVRVHIKDRYIYKTDAKLKKQEADLGEFAGMQACFL